VQALYFSVTTMTTVGYGDMSGNTENEHIFCMLLMVIGVIVFTYVSGALSSILGSMDDNDAELQAQVTFLNDIQSSYNLTNSLYNEIRKALED
jgi:hypothetical protein